MSGPTRRDVLKAGAVASVAAGSINSFANLMNSSSSFQNLLREPDLVRAFGPDQHEIALQGANGIWKGGSAEISVSASANGVELSLHGSGVSCIQFRWRGDLSKIKLFLGDHWERSYADLEWRGDAPNRVMPWYFVTWDGKAAHAYGVETGAGALCFWMADQEGISLWADVRSGGKPVQLGDRILEIARVLCREGHGESAFEATTAFCRRMCPRPMLAKAPLYGTNDWNYAYGNNSAELIASVGALISDLSPNSENRPFSVIDEGWAMGPYNNNFGHGPWEGNPRFGPMDAFAHRLKGVGVRPGIWFRPLTPLPDSPTTWRSQREPDILDPTIPEVREHVAKEIRKFVAWGYEMIKHDFTTWDILGKWGFQMGSIPTDDGWTFHDPTKTTAEVMTELYETIREAAGEAHLIGCNTMGHLSAGTHELQRTGDDTSGRSWDRNRRMGVNTLAFRAPQHRTFFEVDPDIVAFTKSAPMHLTEQWLQLVAESGTALFVAVEPGILDPSHKKALSQALDLASRPGPTGEPLDWMSTMCPRRWKLKDKETEFAWMGEKGGWPFSD